MDRLKGKVAIVTGGASGFGAGMARRFVEEGARVVVADLNAEGALQVAGAMGDNAAGIGADVSSRADTAAMVDLALERFGRLDIMVNNAGYTHRNGDLTGVDEETFDRIVAVNMKAPATKLVPSTTARAVRRSRRRWADRLRNDTRRRADEEDTTGAPWVSG